MGNYCVYVVSPKGYAFTRVVDEVAFSLSCALKKLDAGGKIITNAHDCRGRTPIVLLPNLLSPTDLSALPADAILYNLEQVSPESRWFTRLYVSALQSFQVWDYDEANQQKLEGLGIRGVKVCPIGYVPELTRIRGGGTRTSTCSSMGH